MAWKFDDNKPIYMQLVEMLKIKIITGEYKSGDKIPSVRDFAQEMKVNPNTIQKALAELEAIGLIQTIRTNGKFVTDDKNKIQKIKNEIIKEKILSFITEMEPFHFSKEEMFQLLESERKKNDK